MVKVVIVFFVLILLVALGGSLFVGLGDIPPPTQTIEKTLPDARFSS